MPEPVKQLQTPVKDQPQENVVTTPPVDPEVKPSLGEQAPDKPLPKTADELADDLGDGFDAGWDENQDEDNPTTQDKSTKTSPELDDKGIQSTEDQPTSSEDDKTKPEGDGTGNAPADNDAAPSVEDNPTKSLTDEIRRLNEVLAERDRGQPDQQTQVVPDVPVYTPEEQKELDDFKKEWPDVTRGLDLMMKGYVDGLTKTLGDSIAKLISPTIESVAAREQTEHANALYAAHPDYDKIFDPVMKWIDTLPPVLKNAYEVVKEDGSTQDVIDMLDHYKNVHGIAIMRQSDVTLSPNSKGNKQTNEVKPSTTDTADAEAAKQAAKSLGVVSSQRTQIPQAEDANDFDGAWNEAQRNDRS